MRPRAVGNSDSGAVHSGAGRLQAHYGLGIHEGPVDQETLVAVARHRYVVELTRPDDSFHTPVAVGQERGPILHIVPLTYDIYRCQTN